MTNELINDCVKYIKNTLHISFEKDIIIDPCAGKGELVDAIDSLANFTFHYQIYSKSTNKKIIPLDFLSVDFKQYDQTILAGLWYDNIHIISCPRPDEVGQHIKKCGEFAETISFILPKNYLSIILPNYHLLLSEQLNEEYILKIWSKKKIC